MSLLAEAVTRLERSDSPHAMIGATAMATLGASRSTQDFDILTTDRTVLRSAFWIHVEESGAVVDIHTGDIQDPLAGTVRLSRDGDRPVDVIVGEGPWQERILEESRVRRIGDVEVPVVDEIGLVLLKLYAGGPQDQWDIEQVLLLATHRGRLQDEISARTVDLPKRCQRLWSRIVTPES